MSSITDDFARANQTDLGTAAGGWSWTKSGGAAGDHINIVSNTAKGNLNVPSVFLSYRAESDLAGADHNAQITAVSGWIGDRVIAGVALRFSASADTYYAAVWRPQSATVEVWKVVAGSASQLNTAVAGTSTPTVIKGDISGTTTTTINVYLDGALLLTVADSSSPITGNTRCGIAYYSPDSTQLVMDDWSAADAGGGGATPTPHLLGTLGVGA